MGIVSPVGSTVETAWANVLAGKSGIGPITRFDVSAFPCRFGGAVQGFDLEQYLPAKEARRMDEFMHYGIAAGVQAMADSGLDLEKIDLDRAGVITGSGIGGLQTIEDAAQRLPGGAEPAQDLAVLRALDHHQHDLGAPVDPLRTARARTSAS